MMLNTVVEGRVLGKGITSKGKRYLMVFDGKNVYNVFEGGNLKVDDVKEDQNIKLNCRVIADRMFIQAN